MAALHDLLDGMHGVIFPFGGTVAPGGFLMCDGAAVSRTQYASLFAVIGTAFGAGDGSTTFNVPDLRGEFLRGLDGGRGVDTGRVLGSAQADEFKSHKHALTAYGNTGNDAGAGVARTDGTGSSVAVNEDVRGATGGTETRPRNIAVNYIIKI